MNLFEVIHIRSFSTKDREAAMRAFADLRFLDSKGTIQGMKLLQDVLLETDLRVIIQWQRETIEKAKSALGIQLAAAFTEFGRVHHFVCRECDVSEGATHEKGI